MSRNMSMKKCMSDCNGSDEAYDFAIPELPRGELFRFILCSSWDDPHFIGLNTIELFNAVGQRPQINEMKTNASITRGSLNNVFKNGEANLSTNDPGKMWSARYDNLAEFLYIEIHLKEQESIAMIRIWNYNESRVHALCGVHDLRIELDGITIFQGEISCAFTFESEKESMGDTILFTTNDAILELIAENDKCLRGNEIMRSVLDLHELINDLEEEPLSISATMETSSRIRMSNAPSAHRPTTGDRKPKVQNITRSNDHQLTNINIEEAAPELSAINCSAERKNKTESGKTETGQEDIGLPLLKVFHMELLENWGAPDCIGLTGLQFLGPHGIVLDSLDCSITASSATQTSYRLLNGKNLTRSREDMWLTSYSRNSPPVRITVTFAEPVIVSGICMWNYNASPEMSYAGVRCIQIYVNGKSTSRTHIVKESSSWGDEYYIGLNGIEFYNHHEELIKLLPQNLAAFPESVNILPNVNDDPRTSDKLIDGCNDTKNSSHMWLTPILPNRYARVFVIFDIPTYVSHINVYNYRKTPERGARLITISVDDLIVFSGEVPQTKNPLRTVLSLFSDMNHIYLILSKGDSKKPGVMSTHSTLFIEQELNIFSTSYCRQLHRGLTCNHVLSFVTTGWRAEECKRNISICVKLHSANNMIGDDITKMIRLKECPQYELNINEDIATRMIKTSQKKKYELVIKSAVDQTLSKIKMITNDDHGICHIIRKNRKHCGCSCSLYHVHLKLRNGIKCLVNRPSFPCTYTATDCNNIFGRHEFDKEVVHAHFCAILTHMQTTENQKNDSYLCTAIALDSTTEHYIVGYKPFATMQKAHHMLLFGCDQPGSDEAIWDCGDMTTAGLNFQRASICVGQPSVLYGWGRDAPELYLPEEKLARQSSETLKNMDFAGVGFKVGGNTGIQYLVLQKHLKRHVLLMRTSKYILCIPRTYSSPWRKVSGWVVRENQYGQDIWELIGERNPLLPQMFQSVNKNITIRQGDIVASRCVLNNNEDKEYTMGNTANDEMCNYYLMYWVLGDRILRDNICYSPGPPEYHWTNEAELNNIPKI
ncbi:Protein CBR-PGHM-1 [Dirofilaria immitis]|nr:Protein CBR-PGHM-1 [Dirofilaria immitis]